MGKSKELAELGNAVTQSGGTTTFSDDTTAIVSTQSGSITLQNYAYATGFTYDLSNASQAHSVGTSSSAPTILKTSNIERMRIDASGRVTMPYQPFFDGHIYSGGALAAGTILTLSQYTNTGITLGNNNTRLTVPVDGYYFIHAAQLAQPNSGNYAYFCINVNGSTIYYSHNNFFSETNKDFSATKVRHLGANDYIEFAWLYRDIANSWAGTHSTVSVYKLG